MTNDYSELISILGDTYIGRFGYGITEERAQLFKQAAEAIQALVAERDEAYKLGYEAGAREMKEKTDQLLSTLSIISHGKGLGLQNWTDLAEGEIKRFHRIG